MNKKKGKNGWRKCNLLKEAHEDYLKQLDENGNLKKDIEDAFYHGLTSKQKKQIDEILRKAWDDILDNVLVAEDKDKEGMVRPGVLLSVEEQFKMFANEFGLAALLEE